MAAADGAVLDLSGDALLAIDDTLPLTADLVELCLMHNRITVIERLEPLTALQKLSLRANRIETLGGLAACKALTELELYENQISTLEGLEGLANLTSLDVSFNRIGGIGGLEHAGLAALESRIEFGGNRRGGRRIAEERWLRLRACRAGLSLSVR